MIASCKLLLVQPCRSSYIRRLFQLLIIFGSWGVILENHSHNCLLHLSLLHLVSSLLCPRWNHEATALFCRLSSHPMFSSFFCSCLQEISREAQSRHMLLKAEKPHTKCHRIWCYIHFLKSRSTGLFSSLQITASKRCPRNHVWGTKLKIRAHIDFFALVMPPFLQHCFHTCYHCWNQVLTTEIS